MACDWRQSTARRLAANGGAFIPRNRNDLRPRADLHKRLPQSAPMVGDSLAAPAACDERAYENCSHRHRSVCDRKTTDANRLSKNVLRWKPAATICYSYRPCQTLPPPAW
jgi:hypothetical protein